MTDKTANKMVLLSKRDVFLKLMAAGPTYVQIDATKPGVVAPPGGLSNPCLTLVMGYTLPKPTDDVQALLGGIKVTLSFNGEPFLCYLPWEHIWLIGDDKGTGIVWGDDMPPQAKQEMGVAAAVPPPLPKPEKPQFQVMHGGLSQETETSSAEEPTQVRTNHLRIVR